MQSGLMSKMKTSLQELESLTQMVLPLGNSGKANMGGIGQDSQSLMAFAFATKLGFQKNN